IRDQADIVVIFVSSALFVRGALGGGVKEGPGYVAAFFLSLGHFHSAHEWGADLLEDAQDLWKVALFGYQGAEPVDLIIYLAAFLDEPPYEQGFTAFTPKLSADSAEIQCG